MSIKAMIAHYQLRWLGQVIRMPQEHLPHRVLYGQLHHGQHLAGVLKKRCKDEMISFFFLPNKVYKSTKPWDCCQWPQPVMKLVTNWRRTGLPESNNRELGETHLWLPVTPVPRSLLQPLHVLSTIEHAVGGLGFLATKELIIQDLSGRHHLTRWTTTSK